VAEQEEARRQDARIVRSRAAMREALLDLLAEMPLEDITGALIAARAGVGYATYFRRYQNLRDLLVDTVVNLAEELTERVLPAMIAADTAGAARVLVRAVQERRGAFLALLSGAGDETRGMLARHVVERTAKLPDLSPEWLPQRLAVRFSIASTIEVLDWWLREEPRRDAEEVAGILDQLVMAPLRRPPAP
jgi:AcrR family transcriptional regulator